MKDLKDCFTFDLQDEHMLMEMASIGDIDSKLTIIIRMNDPGNIPHFHIVDKTTLGSKFHTCIKIETAEYFHHTGKEDTLNSKQRKMLVNYLSSKNRRGDLNWEYLVTTWNYNNSSVLVDENIPMPDYTKLK